MNEITINPEEIRNLPDNSITDSETIRQIALWGIKHNDKSLICKIKGGYEFAGLYPHVQKYLNILPAMDELEKKEILETFKWIKVKRYQDDVSLSWEERYKRLEDHHVVETNFLIDKIRSIVKRI